MEKQTSSNVWIEIEYTKDKDLLLSRIEKLNQFCRNANIITDDQYFFLWEHEKGYKPDALGFVTGASGTHSINSDWGLWFNLDYLADPENYNWQDYKHE